ncbi:hypothetical protein C8R44DRAFT_855954, partial [Mycena epipterygia]
MSDIEIPPLPPAQLTDCMSCAEESDATKTMKRCTYCCISGAQTTPPSDATINWENGTRTVDTGCDTSTSNAVKINGSAPTPFDRNITINGGQGGNGGKAGGIGGAGGAGQGNHIQTHLPAGGEITFNVHYGGRDRDLNFVVDTVISLVWLGFITLILACLHHLALVLYF